MQIEEFIASQSVDRQRLLKEIHKIIIANDKTIVPQVEAMMGVQMIIYKDRGLMKYGLASVKKYMSLHLLPIYGSPVLHNRYKELLNKASFQKGCINFTNKDEMPLAIVSNLITDCSTIDLVKIRADFSSPQHHRTHTPHIIHINRFQRLQKR
jgi:hypothetical protein